MKNVVAHFFQNELGVIAIQYGLIAALISVVCIAAMTAASAATSQVPSRQRRALYPPSH